MARKANPDPPWEVAGVSRSTYYRRQKSGGAKPKAAEPVSKSQSVSRETETASQKSGAVRKMPVGRPFQKGVCANPGGRPKEERTLKELARQYTAEAVLTMAEIMRNEDAPHSARVLAAEKLLDRGYGKATQHVEANIRSFDNMELDELKSYVFREIAELGIGHSALEAFGSSATAH